MSVYSQYGVNTYSNNYAVDADTSYSGAEGAFRMMQEAVMNEHDIFGAIIGQDFAEAYARTNPGILSESQLASIQENAAKDVLNKVANFVTKVYEKIKGIIKNITDKVTATLTVDGKKLVKKFEKQIDSKAYDKMSYRYSVPTEKFKTLNADGFNAMNNTVEDLNKDICGISIMDSKLGARYDEDLISGKSATGDSPYDQVKSGNDISRKFDPNIKKHKQYLPNADQELLAPITSDEKEEFLNELLTKLVGISTDSSDFGKDIDKAFFENEVGFVGKFTEHKKQIKESLEDGSSIISAIKKAESRSKIFFNNSLREINGLKKSTDKAISSNKDHSVNTQIVNKLANRLTTYHSIMSTASGKYFAATTSAIKKNFKQSRAIWVMAATYNPVKENTLFLDAIVEASNYEVDCMFE